jgi:maltokinase
VTSPTPAMLGAPADPPAGLLDLLPGYLGRQRWYAGTGEPGSVAVVSARRLPAVEEPGSALWWLVAEAGGDRYQVLVGERPGGDPAEFLKGQERAVVGAAGDAYFYDAVLDPELSLPLLAMISGGAQDAERVRPITAEQSNTSLVYDDRVILKVFRKLMDGPNPDVEVTTALAAGGFEQVAAPVASWREEGVDYMFAQAFLAGGSEGWALALTSLRDFYAVAVDDPAESGGDFAGEARRLGRMTARMHLVLAETYGVSSLPAGGWAALVDDIARRLDGAVPGSTSIPQVAGTLQRLRDQKDAGPAIRVHGDYHLGQVMRTDAGWYVLDFEGEPARDLDARVAAASPLKDVTGMLRSLHYATRFALRDRAAGGATPDDAAGLDRRAEAWEQHNRAAFLDGYHGEDGIADLLPPGDGEGVVADAYELDKALYELGYEQAYRPDWVDIPLSALQRLTGAELSAGGAADGGVAGGAGSV